MKKFRIITLAIVVIAILFTILPRMQPDYELYGDGPIYYLRALGLSEGLGYVSLEIAPKADEYYHKSHGQAYKTESQKTAGQILLPFLMSVPMMIFGNKVAIAKIAFYIYQFSSIWFLFLGFRNIYNSRVSVLFTAFVLLNPVLLSRFPHINNDILFLGFGTYLFSLLYKSTKHADYSAKHFWLIGIGFGILVWLRFGAVGWGTAAVVWCVIDYFLHRDSIHLKRLVGVFGGFTASIFSILVFWSILRPGFIFWFLNIHSGEKGIVPNESTGNWVVEWGKTIIGNILYYSTTTFASLILHIGGVIGILITVILAILIFYGLIKFDKSKLLLFIIFIIVSRIPYLLSKAPSARYMLPLLPLLLVPAAFGAYNILVRFKPTFAKVNLNTKHDLITIFLVPFILWYLFLATPTSLRSYQNPAEEIFGKGRLEMHEAFESIRGKFPEGTVAFSRRIGEGRIYAGYPGIPTPVELDQIEEFETQLFKYRHSLILRDDIYQVTKDILDPWIMKNENKLKLEYEAGNTKLYSVKSNGKD